MLLKQVLGGVRIVALSLVLINRLNKTESAVFLYCRFSLFLKDLFFPDYLELQSHFNLFSNEELLPLGIHM